MRLPNRECITLREITAKRLRSLYIDIPALRPGTVGAYALAIVSVGIATALRVVLDAHLEGAQFVTLYPAIVITTLISGFGAGFVSAVLSTAAADFFLLSPRWAFSVEDPATVADLLLFGPLASYLVIIVGRTRIAAEREQVEARKDRLQLALDAAQLGWWHYDPSRDVILMDARLKEIFDFTADQEPLDEFMKRVHPDDAARVWADRQAALDPADPKPYAHEYRVVQRDGEVRWVDAHGLAYFDGRGRGRRLASFVGTAQDITERKQHEEREHLLMREVNHRAKNMLSVVDAIARQTAARNPEDFVERFSDRVQALSANQDLLIRNEWKGVDIEDLVRAQLAPFADLIGSRIVVRGPTLRLNAASAQAVGLALHELTTNAGKYGAISKDTGQLEIAWGIEDETFTINWTERDGPPVSPPQWRGFGAVVMKEMAERSVGGNVELDYAPTGVTWRLTCPAVNVLEHGREQR
jgi:PAS domain S-box-containing protein